MQMYNYSQSRVQVCFSVNVEIQVCHEKSVYRQRIKTNTKQNRHCIILLKHYNI